MLATAEDVNVYLPQDKVVFVSPDDDVHLIAAERSIKGYLSGTYSATVLESWVDPTTTPDFVREIAAKLAASLKYRKAYSEDIGETSPYAQELYDEAMSAISSLTEGSIVLDVGADEDIRHQIGFFPDDTAPGPAFTMELRF